MISFLKSNQRVLWYCLLKEKLFSSPSSCDRSSSDFHRTLAVACHNLVDLYQVCSNNGPGAKNGPAAGVTCNDDVYKFKKKTFKFYFRRK